MVIFLKERAVLFRLTTHYTYIYIRYTQATDYIFEQNETDIILCLQGHVNTNAGKMSKQVRIPTHEG